MEEIELALTNSTPFTALSREFPDLLIFRWCSSIIDYVEMYGPEDRIQKASIRLKEVTESIHSFVVTEDVLEDRSSTAISCRCNLLNSTIRLAESMNLLWEAPAIYEKGEEKLRLISFSSTEFGSFYGKVASQGTTRIIRKKKIEPDSLRDVYSISLKDIFGDLSTKQAKYLKEAIGKGMFSSPRRLRVEDMARNNGLSKSTMQEHLRKAENKLIRSVEPYLALYLHSTK